jgi:imidazolonepropionase-like amidohydrolase
MRLPIALLAATLATTAGAATPPPPIQHVAFVGVNVIPMTGDVVLRDATVLVSGGRISAIGPTASIVRPRDARIIEARGKYLMPGLAEMHAHVPGAQAEPAYRDDVLFLYVANGVTLARGMLGEPMHLAMRSDLAAHKLLGPRLITSGPSLNGNSVKTVEDAGRMVREQKGAGYDFLKLHPGLKRDVFLAIAATAREVGIDFAGHVSADVGLDLALREGQATIDHLDGFLLRLLPESLRASENPDNLAIANRVDTALLPEIVSLTRAAAAWVVPTQTLYENMTGPIPVEQLTARPELRYAPPRLRDQYRTRKQAVLDTPGYDASIAEKHLAARRSVIRALADGGAGLLLGSDAPQIYNVPGFSLHRELQSMVDAGLTPYQALAMGTVNVARFLGKTEEFGTVAVGRRADLVLLDANPLTDIGNLRRRSGVMLGGRWLPESELQAKLSAIAQRYRD